LAEVEDLGHFLYSHRRTLRFKLFQHVGASLQWPSKSAACSLPLADVHTTVTRCNSLVQYNFAMTVHAEMRWPRYISRIVGTYGALATQRLLIIGS
jgi:hypothetical protein